MHIFQSKIAGMVTTFVIASLAWLIGGQLPIIGAPVIAILLGILCHPLIRHQKALQPGINFTAKYILQTAVVLLGFSLNLTQIMTTTIDSLPIIISTITTALLVAYLYYRYTKIEATTAILVGVGSAICGGSAIAATAPVIDAEESEVAKAISVIFLFNILAAILFPHLGQWLHLSNESFAIFAGTAVNDTSSVTATATAWDAIHHSNTLEQAAIVKLTRTLAIIPITMTLAYLRAKKANTQTTFNWRRAFPTFLIFFIGASLITSVLSHFALTLPGLTLIKTLSKFMIVMAMSAIGLNTNLKKLIQTGGQAIILGAICWFFISVVSLLLI